MTETELFNCVYCENTYKTRGWLASHIRKKHEDANLLDQEMTYMNDNAKDISQQEAAQDLSENSTWDNDTLTAPLGPTSTPRAPAPVPLCPTANSYIQMRGKTLPASFLATLLPAPGFLDDLDKSLHNETNPTDLLRQFEEEIRCFKCEVCGLTFLGNVKLRNHMEIAHQQDFPPSRPDPALFSLGDYLRRLESKIEHCTKLITKQSTQLDKLTAFKDANSQSRTPTTNVKKKPPKIKIDVGNQNLFKCNYCPFTTDHKSQLNLHKSGKHSKELSLVECPMCSFKGNSEPAVTKHVQDHHPDRHNKETSLVECPMCSFTGNSEPEVTKHVQDHHPDVFSCGKCNKIFDSEATLRSRATEEHFHCIECNKDFLTKTDKIKHMAEQHTKDKSEWSLLVGDSHVKAINGRQIEKVLKGNRLRNPAKSSPKEGSAYTTTRDWPGALYPDSNLAERVPALLKERQYNSLIVLTPSNNITNIEHSDKEEQNERAIKSALDTVSIVEKALRENPTLRKVIITELPPRADSLRLAELSEFCNFALRSRIEKSDHKKQITIASLGNLYKYTEKDIFGSHSSRNNDGIHMRGKHGKQAFTNCILAAVESAGFRRQRIFTNTTNISSNSNTANISSNSNTSNIPTSNMFDVLSN